MTKALTSIEKSKKQRDNTKQNKTKNATENFDNTMIVDWLRSVNWSDDSHPTDVVKPDYGIPTFPLIAKAVLSKGQTFKKNLKSSLRRTGTNSQPKRSGHKNYNTKI